MKRKSLTIASIVQRPVHFQEIYWNILQLFIRILSKNSRIKYSLKTNRPHKNIDIREISTLPSSYYDIIFILRKAFTKIIANVGKYRSFSGWCLLAQWSDWQFPRLHTCMTFPPLNHCAVRAQRQLAHKETPESSYLLDMAHASLLS